MIPVTPLVTSTTVAAAAPAFAESPFPTSHLRVEEVADMIGSGASIQVARRARGCGSHSAPCWKRKRFRLRSTARAARRAWLTSTPSVFAIFL